MYVKTRNHADFQNLLECTIHEDTEEPIEYPNLLVAIDIFLKKKRKKNFIVDTCRDIKFH